MKAVFVVGTEEKSLRPITDTTPKLLLPIVGRPLLSYLLESLYKNGIREVYLLLPYAHRRVADYVRAHTPQGMQVHLVFETDGARQQTAQRLAAETEPLCFVSGVHFWNFDLHKAMQVHLQTDADLTALTVPAQMCRSGVVLSIHASGAVTACRAYTPHTALPTAETDSGVYLLRSGCLQTVLQTETETDGFSVLPRLLQYAVYACAAQGYFNDVETPASLVACTQDVLRGKTDFRLPHLADGIFTDSALPKGEYQLFPPVFIGENVTVADGAQIGPNTVLENGCFVGAKAKVENSIVRAGAAIYPYAHLCGATVCENAVIQERASLSGGSVVGASACVGRHAALENGVRVWQHRTVENGMHLSGNVRDCTPQDILFAENGRLCTVPDTLTPIFLAAFGQALGGCTFGQKVGILCDGSAAAVAAAQILSGTLSAQGSRVWHFGKGFLPQLHFYTAFCDLQVGIFLCTQNARLQLYLFSAGGLLLSGVQTSALVTRLQCGDFPSVVSEICRKTADMHDMQTMYLRELLHEAGAVLQEQRVCVQCPNADISMLLEDALYRLQAETGNEITLRLSFDGTRVTAFHRDCGYLPHERLLALCCNALLQSGQDLALSADIPVAFARLAAAHGRHILPYPASATAAAPDTNTHALACTQLYVRDGLFLCMRLLGILQQSGKSLAQIHKELPEFFVRRKTVPVFLSPEEILRALHLPNAELCDAGIVWQSADDRVLITPQQAGKKLRILAESTRFETAKSLCEEVEERLTKH